MAAARCSETQVLAVPGTPSSSSARSVASVATATSISRRGPTYFGVIGVPSAARRRAGRSPRPTATAASRGGRGRSSAAASAASSSAYCVLGVRRSTPAWSPVVASRSSSSISWRKVRAAASASTTGRRRVASAPAAVELLGQPATARRARRRHGRSAASAAQLGELPAVPRCGPAARSALEHRDGELVRPGARVHGEQPVDAERGRSAARGAGRAAIRSRRVRPWRRSRCRSPDRLAQPAAPR